MTFKNTAFEYQFWTVPQLQKIGLTPDFASSFNYFVRDVAKINNSGSDLEDRVNENTDKISENEEAISYNFTYLNGQTKPANYVESNNYVVGNYATYQDRQYRCTNNTTGVFSPSDWQVVNLIDNDIRIYGNFNYLNGADRPGDYVESTNYVVGEYVTESGSQYACVNDTTGAFTPSDWKALSVQGNYEYIVETRQSITDNFVVSGYGAIGLNTPVSLADIAVGVWQTLPMDTNVISAPKFMTQNLANNSLSFLVEGIWNLSPKVSLEFTEVNAGRRLLLRVYNITTNTPGASVYVEGVGRNTDVGGFSFTVPIEVPEADVGDEFVLQISGNASFTSVESIGSVFYMQHASEAKFL